MARCSLGVMQHLQNVILQCKGSRCAEHATFYFEILFGNFPLNLIDIFPALKFFLAVESPWHGGLNIWSIPSSGSLLLNSRMIVGASRTIVGASRTRRIREAIH